MSANNNGINEIFDSFQYLKVLIVGDAMTDKYIFGHTQRVSPESPVPIIEVYRRENRLGRSQRSPQHQRIGCQTYFSYRRRRRRRRARV
ncbi:MAG: hypothetical protein IPL33_12070 [Sphingobacteriales bacterium]|nr:hypothetical protein [Sphingobacteriales bacterium]